MEQNTVRPLRKVAISDKLWDAFDLMAREMGGDRDGLISQALFTFARLNGYLAPGYLVAPEAPHAAPPERAKVGSGPAVAPPPPPAPRREVEAPPPAPAPAPMARREAAESSLRKPSSPPPPPPRIVIEPPQPDSDDDPARREVAERVLETAAELERGLKEKQGHEAAAPEPTGETAGPVAERGLYLMAEDGNLDRVAKERFVIGRGKHCDLVINSGKVSREHAVIIKEGSDFYIEDLGSSNGTWFNKQRIRRRKIEDGDEFFICSEKVKCVVR